MSQPIKHTASSDNPWGDESGIRDVANEGASVTLTATDIESLIRLTRAESGSEINAALVGANSRLGDRGAPMRDLLTQIAIRAHALQRMQQLATVDELTGLFNRRAFRDSATRAIASGERNRKPVALLMLDLDDLKAVNDRSGHSAGDRAIVTVGQCCLDAIRTSDTAARLGGDEFVILLPDTDIEGARNIARRIERTVAGAVVGSQALSVSVGVSVTDTYIRSVDDLVASADAALYRNKREKRDARH
jgi:diguanylate cyclase (GGDEF)-like protein